MSLRKETLLNKKKELDDKWKAKYPQGNFVLQIRHINDCKTYYMHFNTERHTSSFRPKSGIHVEAKSTNIYIIYDHLSQENSIGICKSFNNYTDFILYCQKTNVPFTLIEKFNQYYSSLMEKNK